MRTTLTHPRLGLRKGSLVLLLLSTSRTLAFPQLRPGLNEGLVEVKRDQLQERSPRLLLHSNALQSDASSATNDIVSDDMNDDGQIEVPGEATFGTPGMDPNEDEMPQGHGHWPDSDAVSTAMDATDETDPGEGFAGMNTNIESDPSSANTDSAYMEYKRSVPEEQLTQQPSKPDDPQSPTQASQLQPKRKHKPSQTTSHSSKSVLALGTSIFEATITYLWPAHSPGTGSITPLPYHDHAADNTLHLTVQKGDGDDVQDKESQDSEEDWRKLRHEFALQQQWRRCTTFRDGVCPGGRRN